MVKNKKKSPGRPKKEFVSKKPKTKTQSGPGRPRKDQKDQKVHIATTNHIPSPIVEFVDKSVDNSKKKDLIILGLFFLSFILFLASLYFTFIRDKKTDQSSQPNIAEIANIDTGNIDYTDSDSSNVQISKTATDDVQTPKTVAADMGTENAVDNQYLAQDLDSQQQIVVQFYQAVNSMDTTAIRTMADDHLKQSNVFKTYYSKNRLSKFSENILDPKISITNIQEKPTNSVNQDIKSFSYTLEYTLANTKQKYTEERSTVLIRKGDIWKIGKLMCETKGCSTMPFFNPDKYK